VKLSAVILAGGASRRMGRDKAWMECQGQPLIARALAQLRELRVEEVFISGRPGVDYAALNCPMLLDREPGLGPVAGIERALQAARQPRLLVLAVDLPQMTAVFLRRLIAHCGAQTGVVPQVRGALEPLAAVYPKPCHALAVSFLDAGRRSARDFAEACVQAGMVRVWPVAPADADFFANWNTPADVRPGSL
jgi:molybdopterin-guanine dinucleotide biosynthesis protein A